MAASRKSASSKKALAKADKALIKRQGQELTAHYDKTALKFYGRVRAAHTDDLAKAGELIHYITEVQATIVNCTAHLGVSGEKTESLKVQFSKEEEAQLQVALEADQVMRADNQETVKYKGCFICPRTDHSTSNCPQKDRCQCKFAQRDWKPQSRALTTVGLMC